jgi:hypothetical protein
MIETNPDDPQIMTNKNGQEAENEQNMPCHSLLRRVGLRPSTLPHTDLTFCGLCTCSDPCKAAAKVLP